MNNSNENTNALILSAAEQWIKLVLAQIESKKHAINANKLANEDK